MRRFEGRVALVTGAASGIGRAAALRLAGEGARIVLADRDEAGLTAVAETARRDHGAEAVTLVYDAADGDASAAMAAEAARTFGRLDCAVCNAGIYRRNHFADIPPEEWETVFAVNLGSVFRIVQAALPALKASRGNVVSISSTSGIHGIAYAAHYAAAKAGIIAMTKSLAVEFAPDGVRFNAICPGRVRTGIGAGLKPLADQNEALLVRPPKLAGRTEGGEPDDLAAAVAYLASDDARYVSGSVLVADGAQNIG
jgi:NAD(P)-dependent dehydrogenase (short-subunit alcohol dehydrogenase family)